MVTVHYFYDPMCGWCFGASALIDEIEKADNIQIDLHPGGMMNRQPIEQSFRSHIIQSDEEISRLTGAFFADDYKARLRSDSNVVFDSYITIRAILVAKEMGLSPLVMLKAIQHAHFQKGLAVELQQTLNEIALSLDLDESIWLEKMQQAEERVVGTIRETSALMNQHSVQGYPTLIIESDKGATHLPHTTYYKNIDGWKQLLSTLS